MVYGEYDEPGRQKNKAKIKGSHAQPIEKATSEHCTLENSNPIWKNKPNFQRTKMSLCIYMKGDYESWYGFMERKNKANYKHRIGRRVDSRFRGNDKYGITTSRREKGIWKNKANLLEGKLALSQ